MFEPVDLINPVTGNRYTARNAVDLNDRLVEGYHRADSDIDDAADDAVVVDEHDEHDVTAEYTGANDYESYTVEYTRD